MTWFKVDDSFHSHPKVLAAPPAALGLWVVAGSWSGGTLSDGFIPDHVLPRLIPDAATLAQQLVAAGLWRRARGGYRFHDWGDFNPQREVIEEERKAARERMRAVRARQKDGQTRDHRGHFEQTSIKAVDNFEGTATANVSAGQHTDRSSEHPTNVRPMFATPTRPDPYKGGALGDPPTPGAREPAPPPRCPEHLGSPSDAPCRRCGEARATRERWDLTDSERRRAAPQCRSHRGQPAANCALCRSEALAAKEAQP